MVVFKVLVNFDGSVKIVDYDFKVSIMILVNLIVVVSDVVMQWYFNLVMKGGQFIESYVWVLVLFQLDLLFDVVFVVDFEN